MNQCIELHDSTVSAITETSDSVTVCLRPAYLHRSTGSPGWDAGTVWEQDFDLTFANATVTKSFTDLPQVVDTGWLDIGATCYEDCLPLPLVRNEEVKFAASGMLGEWLQIQSKGIRISTAREAKYVEEFPGSR